MLNILSITQRERMKIILFPYLFYYLMTNFSFKASSRRRNACLLGNGLLNASYTNCPFK